jgi:hypothetical protein
MKKGFYIGLAIGVVYYVLIVLVSVGEIFNEPGYFFSILILFSLGGSLIGLVRQKIMRYWLRGFLTSLPIGVLSALIYWQRFFSTFLTCWASPSSWRCGDSASALFLIFESPFKMVIAWFRIILDAYGPYRGYSYTLIGVNGKYEFDIIITLSGIVLYVFAGTLIGYLYGKLKNYNYKRQTIN